MSAGRSWAPPQYTHEITPPTLARGCTGPAQADSGPGAESASGRHRHLLDQARRLRAAPAVGLVAVSIAPEEEGLPVAVVGDAGNNAFVWVIPEDGGTPVKTTVQIGEVRSDGIEIISGLNTGELVAISGVHSLRNDMRVRPAHPGREGLDQ